MWVHSQRPRRVSPWVRPLLVYVCWSLCLCGLLPYAQAAPAVTLQARLAETAIYLGESTSLELRISGIRNPPVPELTHPAIEISSAGGQNFSNSSYSMINGQVRQTEDFGHVARYLLRPHQAGALDIPPIVLVHEGQTYRSNPLTLQVQRPAAQDTLLVEVLISKPSYVLGETVTLTLDLSLRKLVTSGAPLDADPFFREQPPHLQIPWFESLGDWKTTDLKTFAQPFLGNQQRPGFAINDYRRDGMFQSSPLTFTLPRRSSTRTTASGAAEYFTYQLQKHFRPVQTGIQSIPPVTVKANLPTQVDARGRALRTEKFVGSSAPLTVEIRPVPSTGQPASFRGAVGRFQLDVDVNPKILRVGDPLSLSLTLRGEGLLETVHPPALERQAKLAQDFKLQADPPAVKTESEAKTFTYTLRPRHVGIRELPPLEVAYFDPETQRFQVLRSAAIPLRVDAASTLAVTDVVDPTGDSIKSTPGQELAEGILANYSGEEMLAPQHFQVQVGWLSGLFLALPPVAYGVVFLWRWRRQRQQHPDAQRARRARERALGQLQALKAQQASDNTLCDGVHQAVVGYISDRLSLVGAGLTVDDVTRHLQARQLDQELIEQVAALLQLCDSARYAPGSIVVAQLTGLLEEATGLIQRLERSQRL